jgi:excisionase family DNA binding protein
MDGHPGKWRWPMPRERKVPKNYRLPVELTTKQEAVRVNVWCHLFDVSRSHAYELMREGKLHFYYVGKSRRIPLDQPVIDDPQRQGKHLERVQQQLAEKRREQPSKPIAA